MTRDSGSRAERQDRNGLGPKDGRAAPVEGHRPTSVANLTPSGVERIRAEAFEEAAKVAETLLGGGQYATTNKQFAGAIRRLAALPFEPPSVIHWEGTEDDQHRERMKACRARRAQWGEDDCEEKDGSCAECTADMAEALRVDPLPELPPPPSQGDVK